MRVELVVALRNAEARIPRLLAEVAALALPDGVSLELRFVDDASSDRSLDLLRAASQAALVGPGPRVHFDALGDAHGSSLALVFGLARSEADASITLDANASHPLELVPAMLRAHRAGAEVVQAVRCDPPVAPAWRAAASDAVARGASFITGTDLRRQNVPFRLVSARVRKHILAEPRWWHFLRLPLQRDAEFAPIAYLEFRATGGTADWMADAGNRDLLQGIALEFDGLVALLSPRRVTAIVALLAGAGAIHAASGQAEMALACGLPAGALAAESWRLGRAGLLDAMRGRIRASSEPLTIEADPDQGGS